MAGVARRTTAVIGLTAAVLAIAACSASVSPEAKGAAAVRMLPQHILRAPKSLIAVAEPQPDGLMWMLAGSASMSRARSAFARLREIISSSSLKEASGSERLA